MNTPHEPTTQQAEQTDEQAQGKMPYSSPRLLAYGDLRDLTMADSPGSFESGRGFSYRTPGIDDSPIPGAPDLNAPSGGPSVAP